MPTIDPSLTTLVAPLVTNNITALECALAVIDELPDGVFADQSNSSFSASVGEHFRHIIEHYQLFLNSWPDGLVDYNRRPRNTRLETDPATARTGIEDLCQRLRALQDDDLTQPLAVCCSTGDQAESPVPSSVSRELVFLHGHSVHHFALIVLILKQRGISINSDFGIAPSTQTHRLLG